LIDKEQFAKMKDGVRIINCARGGIVNEEALYEALTSGKVAGAALDVFAEEPPTNWKLLKLDNVIGSPHIGAATKEAQDRVGAEVAEKLIEFAKKMQPA
jgi:D-3-phosphoglycerate dehydrogenase